MQGFIVFDYTPEYPEARKVLAGWLGEGKIKRTETIIKGGLVAAEEALVGLFKGVNTGKPGICSSTCVLPTSSPATTRKTFG